MVEKFTKKEIGHMVAVVKKGGGNLTQALKQLTAEGIKVSYPTLKRFAVEGGVTLRGPGRPKVVAK